VPQGIGATSSNARRLLGKDVDEFALALAETRDVARRKDGSRSRVPVKDVSGMVVLDNDEFIRSDATLEGLGGLKPHSSRWADGLNATRCASTPRSKKLPRAPRGNSSALSMELRRACRQQAASARNWAETRARIVATAVTGSDRRSCSPALRLRCARRLSVQEWT